MVSMKILPNIIGLPLKKKIFAHIYIDDSALGIPLKHDEYSTLPYVDWNGVEILLKMRGILQILKRFHAKKTIYKERIY